MKPLTCFGIFTTLGWSLPLSANALVDVPLQEQMKVADAVIIATAAKMVFCSSGEADKNCIEFYDTVFLKGNGPGRIKLDPRTRVEEAEVECCVADNVYLLFAVKRGDSYFLIHGRSSIRTLEPLPVVPCAEGQNAAAPMIP